MFCNVTFIYMQLALSAAARSNLIKFTAPLLGGTHGHFKPTNTVGNDNTLMVCFYASV